jgi:exonuclease SbcC
VGFSGERNFTEGTRFLKDKNAQLKIQLEEIDTQIQHFKVQLKLEEFAVGLHEGEACPVCGSLHHPDLLVAADVAENLKRAENKKKTLEKEVQICDQLSLRLAELNNLLLLNEKQLTGVQVKRKEFEVKKVAHQQLFQWEKYRTIEAVKEAFSLAESVKKTIELLEKQREEANRKYDLELQNKEKYQSGIDKINSEIITNKAETATLKAQINLVDATGYSEKSKVEIEAEKKALLQRYFDLEKQFNLLNNQLQELRKGKDVLSGSIAANQTQLTLEKSLSEKLKQELEKELDSSDFETKEAVLQILNQELDVASGKKKIAVFRQEISITRDQLEQLTNEIGERKYDLETHRQVQEQLGKDRLELDQLNRDLGVTEKSMADLQKSLDSQAQLRKELENLELRAENIKTMKSLFKASGFVNYISSVYLQNLCNAANDRFFQLTRQKLSLEITDDNNFLIRDYLNGGKVRSVKTLSGGQTFQAALSLALALADNIQKITDSNQNFFFLDEGFGSLDKDSLAVVFDTLKSLRKENRIVGVISHVEEMQQEIDTHLRIENHDETGSRILTSWGS